MPSQPTMNDEQFTRLSDVIYNRAGIHFPANKKYVLESRLARRLQELDFEDFEQYIAFLTMGPYQMDEFQEMFNRITINETSFFRNEPQLNVFESVLLPEILEARASSKRIRIWSAACSSGEEPFTLAMIMDRSLGVRLADWKVEILGTDISERTLEIASSGVYSDYALRTTPPLVKSRYFVEEKGGWRLHDRIRNMVNFELHNLKDRLAAKRHGTWDVIFCRNVMIYFDDPMKAQVVETFAQQLASDGALFIGHSENIRGCTTALEAAPIPQGFCYRPIAMTKKAAA
ncbi:MAG: chemotaxis protein [Phycisphaerae bacterium]|nr:chemotaxis protein [Phycisphaerae bacterium]